MLTFTKVVLATALCLSSNINAAEYLIPYDYDNIVQSVKSQGYGVIVQASPLSTSQWNIGGTPRNYRCLSIPKINCSAAAPVLYANVSEIILTNPHGTVSEQKPVIPLIYDLRYEDAGANWNLCGAAIGGTMYDDINYSGGAITYTPNKYSDTFPFFTNIAITNSTAYMAVSYNQICQ